VLAPDDVRVALLRRPTPPFDVRSLLGPGARDAVVLVPLSFEGPWPAVHVLVRSSELRDHAGEVSFPGGKIEPGEAPLEALLREAEEEVGLSASEIHVLGELSSVPVVTGRFLIHPYVAQVHARPRITSSEHAVSYEVPLARWLRDGEVIDVTSAPWRGLPLLVPHFPIGAHVMYGASAVVLFDLLSRLSPAPLATRVVADKPWGDRYAADEQARLLRAGVGDAPHEQDE